MILPWNVLRFTDNRGTLPWISGEWGERICRINTSPGPPDGGHPSPIREGKVLNQILNSGSQLTRIKQIKSGTVPP